jgi:SHS2 domain-containing protein
MSFEELEHTADIRVRVKARTLEDLFLESALGVMKIMYGNPGHGNIERSIRVEAEGLENLILDFLSEVLYLSEVDSVVFSSARISLSGNTLSATLQGEPFDVEKHRGGTEIKGISYSGLRILKDDTGYVLDILFDV